MGEKSLNAIFSFSIRLRDENIINVKDYISGLELVVQKIIGEDNGGFQNVVIATVLEKCRDTCAPRVTLRAMDAIGPMGPARRVSIESVCFLQEDNIWVM